MTRRLPPTWNRLLAALGFGAGLERLAAGRRGIRTVRDVARRRTLLVCTGVLAGMLFVLICSASTMLRYDDRLASMAEVQFHEEVVQEARKGEILDRDGGVLATTVAMPSLHADPLYTRDDAPALARRLAPVLDAPVEWLEERLARANSRDVLLARNLEPAVVEQARGLARNNQLFTRQENRRYYPGGTMVAALLGAGPSVGPGFEGVEGAMDRHLRGDTYRFARLRDRRGRGLRSPAGAFHLAHRGNDVILTIDRVIQLAAERALDKVMEESEPLAAHIVAMDPRTGEILAMANRPATNPNDRAGLDLKGLRNHAVADELEPGSVFKPFVMALALDQGLVTEDSTIDCANGRWHVGRVPIRDTHAHEILTIEEVLKFSSNIGTAKLALRMGAEPVVEGLRDFGFGRVPGLGLRGEAKGVVRNASTIRPIELATTAYGQGVTSSTLQLAAAVAVIANDGVRMRPYLVSEVRDPYGEVLLSTEPEEDRRVVGVEAARAVARMMVSVTEEGGTGTRAMVEGYDVAGKTGTAWKVVDKAYSPTARVSSFVGFLPAQEPRLAVAVVVDTPSKGSRYGGIVAAPPFASVGAVAMRHMGVPRRAIVEHDPASEQEPTSPPAALEEEPDDIALAWADSGRFQVPDLTGLCLRDVLTLFQGSGLQLSLQGSGRAVAQHPEPGALVQVGGPVEVSFR